MILNEFETFLNAFCQGTLTMSLCMRMCTELKEYITMLPDSVRSHEYYGKLNLLMKFSHEDFVGTVGTGNEKEEVKYPYYWIIENFLVCPLADKGIVIPKEHFKELKSAFRTLPDKLDYIRSFYTIMYGERSINETLLRTFKDNKSIAERCIAEINKIPDTEKQYKALVIRTWLSFKPTKEKFFSSQELADMFNDITGKTDKSAFVYQNVSNNNFFKKYFEFK